MFEDTTVPEGFKAADRDEHTPRGDTLPVLLATVSLFVSTAILLTTVMTMSARAAELF
jgi:hypothetical protein